MPFDFTPDIHQRKSGSNMWLMTHYERSLCSSEITNIPSIKNYIYKQCQCNGKLHWHLFFTTEKNTTHIKYFRSIGILPILKIVCKSMKDDVIFKLLNIRGPYIRDEIKTIPSPPTITIPSPPTITIPCAYDHKTLLRK